MTGFVAGKAVSKDRVIACVDRFDLPLADAMVSVYIDDFDPLTLGHVLSEVVFHPNAPFGFGLREHLFVFLLVRWKEKKYKQRGGNAC